MRTGIGGKSVPGEAVDGLDGVAVVTAFLKISSYDK